MINLQDPLINTPLFLVEVDKYVFDIQTKLEINLSWLTHAYARAYRHIKIKDGKKIYFPEVYTGIKKGNPTYYRPTPDNDKKAMMFFVVGKEEVIDFQKNQKNFLKHDLSLVFWCNLALINNAILETEIFTQNLIQEVRNVLTNKFNGVEYRFDVLEVVREFQEVYKEFSLDESENYMLAPYQAFRINGTLTYQEDCLSVPTSSCDILNQNISQNEILTCFLPNLDFLNVNVFNSLTAQQKIDLNIMLNP